MSLISLDNRTTLREDSLAYLKRQKGTEERIACGKANSDRLRWKMFLRVHGVDSEGWTELDLEKTTSHDSREEVKAFLAYRKILQSGISKYEGRIVKYDDMTEEEMALA